MQEQEIDLQIGDSVKIGDFTVTVVDIEDGELSVRIDPVDEFDELEIVDGVVRTRQ